MIQMLCRTRCHLFFLSRGILVAAPAHAPVLSPKCLLPALRAASPLRPAAPAAPPRQRAAPGRGGGRSGRGGGRRPATARTRGSGWAAPPPAPRTWGRCSRPAAAGTPRLRGAGWGVGGGGGVRRRTCGSGVQDCSSTRRCVAVKGPGRAAPLSHGGSPTKAAAPGAREFLEGKPMRTRLTELEPGGAGGGTACAITSSWKWPSPVATAGTHPQTRGGSSASARALLCQRQPRWATRGQATACGEVGVQAQGRPRQAAS
jgi:hypothetical protein